MDGRSRVALVFLLIIQPLVLATPRAEAQSPSRSVDLRIVSEILESMHGHEAMDSEERRRIVDGLASRGEAIYPALIAILRRIDDWLSRAAAAQIILAIEGDKRPFLPVLRTLCTREDHRARELGCVMLGRIGEPGDVPLLRGMLKDRAAGVRRGAANSLSMLAGPEVADEAEKRFLDSDLDRILARSLEASTKGVSETDAELKYGCELPAAEATVTPEEAQVSPSNEGTRWTYLVVGLAAGLAIAAAGAWLLLRRRSGG